MAYVTNTTLVTGCVVTAAHWNVGVNNDEYLKGRSGSVLIEDGLEALKTISSACGINVGAASGAGVGTIRLYDTVSLYGEIVGHDSVAYRALRLNAASMTLFISGASKINFDTAGAMLIGDTSNAKMTVGLTINQGANTDEAFAIKSSDVAHGMTSLAETDTYGDMGNNGACGGVVLRGYSEGSGGLVLMGNAGDADVARSTAALGSVQVLGRKKSGTSVAALGANGNILTVADLASTKFIFDADGDFHADAAVSASSYDRFDDVAAVRALELHRSPAAIAHDTFDEWVNYSRRDLEAMKIATFNDQPGGDGSVFINYTALSRLHSGALWQLHKRLVLIEQVLSDPISAVKKALHNRLVRIRWWEKWHDLRRRLSRPAAGRG